MNDEKNLVVLVIDDDTGVRDVSKLYIEDFSGREVVTCSTIDEAVNLASEYLVGLVITDYFMKGEPRKNLDLLRQTYPGTPIICHTGSEKIKPKMGYDQVVYKPEGLDTLVEITQTRFS